MFRFPWGDMHSLNLGWFLQKFNELREDWATAEAGIDGALDAEIQKAEDALSDVFDARDAAAASATAAAGSASAANTSKTAAQNSATAAASSATLANQKATAAGLSEAAAAQSATAASNSASAAATSATQAGNGASAAQSSAAAAGSSATAAAGSATAAGQEATNAAGSATAAAASETAAAGSATAAAASAAAAATAANWHTSLAYPLVNNIDKTATPIGTLEIVKKGSHFNVSGDRGASSAYICLTDEIIAITTEQYHPEYFQKVNALSNEGLIIDVKGSASFTGTLSGTRLRFTVTEYTDSPEGGSSPSVASAVIDNETFDTSYFLPLANAIGKNCRIVAYFRANVFDLEFIIRYGTAPASGLQSIRPLGEIETNEPADILPVTRPETE